MHLNLEDLADISISDSSDDDENQFSEEEWPSANEEEEELMRLTHDLQATNEKKPQLKPQPPPPPKQSQKMGALLPYGNLKNLIAFYVISDTCTIILVLNM